MQCISRAKMCQVCDQQDSFIQMHLLFMNNEFRLMLSLDLTSDVFLLITYYLLFSYAILLS